jgi:hypothetical protein
MDRSVVSRVVPRVKEQMGVEEGVRRSRRGRYGIGVAGMVRVGRIVLVIAIVVVYSGWDTGSALARTEHGLIGEFSGAKRPAGSFGELSGIAVDG